MQPDAEDAFFTAAPPEVVVGRVKLTPDQPMAYAVVFKLGDQVLSEHPVATVREGEAMIRQRLADVQFSLRQQRPNPHAPTPSMPDTH